MQFLADFGKIRAKFLQTIIEVRQVNECQRRVMSFFDRHRSVGDPAGGFDIRIGSPEIEQRELT
ncbi:hypothetical protein D3C87_2053320 [compost metagenome]